MAKKTICLLGFPWEEMCAFKRAAMRADVKIVETRERADLVIVNGSSNVTTGNECIALVDNDVEFREARQAGAKAAYPRQKGWQFLAAILEQIVADSDMPIPRIALAI